MTDLSIIIVSYNTRDLLRACLQSVIKGLPLAQLKNGYEILVVDNASTDGSVTMIKAESPQVRLIENTSNVGFAAGNNQGIRQSCGRSLLLLNPDTLILDNAIGELSHFLDTHPAVGLVSGKLLYPDGSFQHSAFTFPNLWMSFFDFFPINHRLINSRLNGRYPLSAYAQSFAIDHPLGACMMVRREVIEQVGLLSEEFFMYGEEIDWCIRIKKAGWQIYCQPKAEIVHYSGESTKQAWGTMFVELHKSRFRLFRKHYSPTFRWAVRWIVRLGIGREMLRASWNYRRGRIERSEMELRQHTYRKVLEVTKAYG